MNIEDLKQSLTCCICMEVATLPVHSTCCVDANSRPPACMKCVRAYLELNKPFHERPYNKKSWNGCGCTINVRQRADNIYKHTVQLDAIRNLLGPSVCHHEGCKEEFSTTAELRRHLSGTARPTDKITNCQYAKTKCKHCNFFGVRHIVEGEHYREYHHTVFCPFCNMDIGVANAKQHYEKHEHCH